MNFAVVRHPLMLNKMGGFFFFGGKKKPPFDYAEGVIEDPLHNAKNFLASGLYHRPIPTTVAVHRMAGILGQTAKCDGHNESLKLSAMFNSAFDG